MTPHMFLYIKRQINNQRIVCYYQNSANQTANGCFFAVKYGTPYGGIRDSEQLRRDTIWGYPEYGASNCVRHMVSPGLDGLRGSTCNHEEEPFSRARLTALRVT